MSEVTNHGECSRGSWNLDLEFMRWVGAKAIVWGSVTEWWVVRTEELHEALVGGYRVGTREKISKMLGISHILNPYIKSCWFLHSSPPLLSLWSMPPSSLTLMVVMPPDWVLCTTVASLKSNLYTVSRESFPKGKSNHVSLVLKNPVAPHASILNFVHLTWFQGPFEILALPINIKTITNIYWTLLNISTYSKYFTFVILLNIHN